VKTLLANTEDAYGSRGRRIRRARRLRWALARFHRRPGRALLPLPGDGGARQGL